MISPTGSFEIRNDAKGSGAYGAKRGGRAHSGVDYKCIPGQDIIMPFSGLIERIAYPYPDKSYGGVVISNDKMTMKIFYFSPLQAVIGEYRFEKEVIGVAQDISDRYPATKENPGKMTPHIHIEIEVDPHFMFVSQCLIDELAGVCGSHA